MRRPDGLVAAAQSVVRDLKLVINEKERGPVRERDRAEIARLQSWLELLASELDRPARNWSAIAAITMGIASVTSPMIQGAANGVAGAVAAQHLSESVAEFQHCLEVEGTRTPSNQKSADETGEVVDGQAPAGPPASGSRTEQDDSSDLGQPEDDPAYKELLDELDDEWKETQKQDTLEEIERDRVSRLGVGQLPAEQYEKSRSDQGKL